MTVLEEMLGDPDSTAREVAALDAAEAFPATICARLDAFGLAGYYVPVEAGGRLADHELLLRLWRAVARRDVSTAVAHAKTYLGVAPVWIAGRADQAARVAGLVLDGAVVSWALSEREHGADLTNGACTAAPHGGGYRLDGVKWPINNATRARLLTVLARTSPRGGARGHSLVLFDKTTAAPGTWRVLPKAPTHGNRGLDVSGIEFAGADIPAGARIGAEGSGVETVLRALQLTRTMCAVLSLGAGEHAVRLAARHLATRPGRQHAPHAPVLARCAAFLAAVEAAALVSSRAIHGLTAEMSVVSAVVKGLAPTLVDASLAGLADLLGEHAVLTAAGGTAAGGTGAFQKVRRDHQVVSIFDGSTPVNRAALIQQFPRLVRGYADAAVDADGLRQATAVGSPVRALHPAALTLVSRHGCSLVQSLPRLAASLAASAGAASLAASAGAADLAAGDATLGLAHQAAALRGLADLLHARMAGTRLAARPAMAAYELAAAYELCYAGAACLHAWSAGQTAHRGEPLWEDALWARAALRALLARLARTLRTPPPAAAPGDEQIDDALVRAVTDAVERGTPVTPFGDPMPAVAFDRPSVAGGGADAR
ncbi:acyl-CoA dehydrogenase family protein [Dactylosporangium sp. NPDC049742]|uniref:acyl-CoA dehydrogenase family protein n=1 Tax=Dactylosporangium sp. NPDC049742 TaxID=3154737 RepID=UPI0034178152